MRLSFIALAAFAVVGVALPGRAIADQVSTQIASPKGSPVSIQRCQIDVPPYEYSNPTAWVNVENRTKHELLSVDVEYSFYDADKAMFGQATIQYTPQSPLASGDVQQYSGTFYPSHSEPFTATSFVKCRIMAATFTGQHSWRYGQKWRESLVSSDMVPQTSDVVSSGVAAPAKISVHVLSAWSDPAPRFQTGYYIHDRISIDAPVSAVTVHPHDFILHVHDAGGAQTVRGLSESAPKYQKWNYALREYEVHSEVDPADDLGARGSLDVPAHANATTVVTFYVRSPSLDTSNLSDVSYLF